MNFVCQTFCVRLLDWRSMLLNKDSGDFCFQDIHVSASNFLFHDDKKKGDSCPNWNINMCVSCLHTQLWAKPMRCIPKSTNSYPKQYYHHIIYSRIPQFTPCRPLHVHCIQWHNLRIRFLNLRIILVDGLSVFQPLDRLVVWIGGFTLQHQSPCLTLSLVLQFLKELDISCNKYTKFKACTAILYRFS